MSDERVPVPRHVKIEAAWEGLTLLEAVRRAFPDMAPREVFRKARRREVLRDGRPCHPLDRLSAGDVLTVILHLPPRPAELPVLRADADVATPAGPFRIVREDTQLLVVSKPPGCASHPALRHAGDTLIERVRAYLGVSRSDEFQPALANRLDIDTSGLVLVGKTRRAQGRLGRLLQRGAVDKTYLALVGGWPAAGEGEIRVPLTRHPDSRELARQRHLGVACRPPKEQEAATRFRVLRRLGPPVACTLLEVDLLTGRTHQIRRHFAHVGLPLAGDRRYGDPELNEAVASVGGLGRLFLHAFRVRLAHPVSGVPLDLQAPLPADLTACLTALGLRADGEDPALVGLFP